MRALPLLAVAFALVLSPGSARAVTQDPEAARLERAAELLRSRTEGDVRKGADLCAELDSREAVALLLEVLNETERRGNGFLPEPHYRDVAWEGLERIQDVYAQQEVERELKANKKNAFVRQWCAELLGHYGKASFGDTLRRALGDRDDGVRRAAARSLGQIKDAGSVRALKKVAEDRDPYARANAIEALARIDLATWKPVLLDAIAGDEDGGVRCALLGGAAALLEEDELERVSAAALADDDWRPRMQAVDNLAAIRTKASVDALIPATADGRPVVGVRAVEALQALTGQKHTRTEAWEAWWTANRETFELPVGGGAAKVVDDGRSQATYNGILLLSDHAAFLIDRSQAMGEPLTSRGVPKNRAALEELSRVFETLLATEGRLTFNVFNYNTEVDEFRREPIELSSTIATKATKFVEKAEPDGPKDIWRVLERVLSDPTLDTAYLLSSGEPDVGLYVHWNRVTRALKDLNRFHKVVVHTIAYSDNKWYRDQLERIAQATGGEFQYFE